MKLPEFSKITQDKNTVPEWAKFLKDGEFISYTPGYRTKIYFDLFDKYTYPCAETGDITYYVYDPVKHGGDPHKKYPVLMWLHGMSNALDGVNCIMCCGAEQYASPKYQSEMGGAYIIVPLANEKRQADGSITGSWAKEYSAPVKGIYDKVCGDNGENVGCKFVMGASSGGYFTWQLLEDNPTFFDGAIPMASSYIPDDSKLDEITAEIIVAHGKHDEMADFDRCVKPRLPKLSAMKNVLCFFPEWVYNSDGGVASIHFGLEMGQHCMINWVQSNLMFDDGTPADKRLPNGVTGWVRSVCEKFGKK